MEEGTRNRTKRKRNEGNKGKRTKHFTHKSSTSSVISVEEEKIDPFITNIDEIPLIDQQPQYPKAEEVDRTKGFELRKYE